MPGIWVAGESCPWLWGQLLAVQSLGSAVDSAPKEHIQVQATDWGEPEPQWEWGLKLPCSLCPTTKGDVRGGSRDHTAALGLGAALMLLSSQSDS